MLRCVTITHSRRGVLVHMNEPDGFSQVEHEWRTSVTAIRAAAEILRDCAELATLERSRFVEAILEESRRLSRTFENISEFV